MQYDPAATLRELNACARVLDALRRELATARHRGDATAVKTIRQQMGNVYNWAEIITAEIGR